jgi:Glu-tRNA(Gln) amidotransferase subunit E-like FAD-binding protein
LHPASFGGIVGGIVILPVLGYPQIMALTNIEITKAKKLDKPYKLSDSGGLYLLVNTTGSKSWRLKYRFLGKEKVLSLGQYPHVSLLEAREAREAAKKLLAFGQDPSEVKKSNKKTAKLEAANTFEVVAREWHDKFKMKWVKKNSARNLSMLENHIFPYVGKTAITKIRSSELLNAIQKIEARGNNETAHRTLQVCGQVFRYAISTDRAATDLSVVLKGALSPVVSKHHASLV